MTRYVTGTELLSLEATIRRSPAQPIALCAAATADLRVAHHFTGMRYSKMESGRRVSYQNRAVRMILSTYRFLASTHVFGMTTRFKS